MKKIKENSSYDFVRSCCYELKATTVLLNLINSDSVLSFQFHNPLVNVFLVSLCGN